MTSTYHAPISLYLIPSQHVATTHLSSCNQCAYIQCIASETSTPKAGVSKGAVAGAVVVTILVLAATVAGYFWYRRRQRLRQQNAAPESDAKPDVPARAEDVLNRPDPNEKPDSPPPQLNNVRIYSGNLHGTINLDPTASDLGHGQSSSGASVQSNPFEDNHSIQTTSTGTQSNVIPIALVPPGSVASSAHSHDRNIGTNSRSDMNLDHVNISNDSLGPRGGAPPMRSANANDGSNNRMSYMTTGSFASDFLETSVIVTPTRGTVKQVVGVAKAQVLSAPSSDNLSRSSTQSKQMRSPLASSSFGPADVMHETDEEQEVIVSGNPFTDSASPYPTSSPTPSTTTFGSPSPSFGGRTDSRADSNWLQEDPAHLYSSSNDERPTSVYTQASAIVADISNARRVHLGFDQITHMPQTPVSAALSTPRTPYRMTSAKLITPVVNQSAAIPTGGSSAAGHLEAQQARALKELNAESGKRMSMSSVITTSTRADSILESFPFVPPSPISNLPPRTPPRSPLAQQSFGNSQDDHAQSATEMVNRARASASSSSTLSSPLVPPNRKVLGMSVSSQSSTVSNGLGSFPFHIESSTTQEAPTSTAPSSFSNSSDGSSAQRKRASLDTLALTSDLSSYPLGFDKTPVPPVPRR